ncbi:MAG TPA: hypothetical protein VN289_00610 [Paraburkholderia sp.]|nr:hypothetical protein [Paraburkholderia sp.]
MNLQFDTLQELEQFLMFSAHIGRAFATAPQDTVCNEPLPPADAYVQAAEAMSQSLAGAPEAVEPPNAAEVPKRKRRTKAEIEADEKAAAVASAPELEPTPEPQADAPGDGNPFAQSAATQAILEAPTHAATMAAAGEAMQRPFEEAAPTPTARVVESIDHLRACQAFIQKHGMPKYNESFQGGLSANIAAYTPEQRVQHVMILESLTSS